MDHLLLLAQAVQVVVPLRVGRGIQKKVLQAMAIGRRAVASPQGFGGIRAGPGRDLLVAAGPEETARLAGEVLDGDHPGPDREARRARSQNHDRAATLQRLDGLTLTSRDAVGLRKANA